MKKKTIMLSILCILSLVGCNNGTETMYQLGFMVDGVFYEKSAQPMPAEVEDSAIIGYIKSYSDTIPTKDGETNISEDLIDAPYAKVEGGIALLYENEWYLCKAEISEDVPEEAERKEWSVQEIASLFSDNAEPDWKMVECVSAYDFAYDRVGVVLYTESDTEHINAAFMDKEGIMQRCGIEAVLDENSEFTYHGNGEVTFNVCSKDGFKCKQKIIFSKNDEGVNFVSETVDFEAKHMVIDLSAVKESYAEGDAVTPLNLRIISEEKNGVDWANDWYNNENLMLPMIGDEWNHFYDEAYEYQWVGDQLEIYEKETGHCLYVLEYPTDKWYVNGNNAYLIDGIFYGASVTNGYAQPDTCFMFAYDLKNEELLWRSADQSYNTMNFIVKDDIIICGYGFTDERDYLYQINKNTGEIIEKIELKKKPDLLVEQKGKLYVHTYSYNYVLEIGE